MSEYILSVGIEVHAELLTQSKMFCRCPVAFGGEPNTRVCPVCMGLPGALPVANRKAIELVLRTALALNCTVPKLSIFHRKNYFYPDLPKGFQISQYEETNPIGYHGYLDIPTESGGTKRIKIRRVHLEEDTGKLMELPGGGTGIDYNRSGVPLMEIVTEFPPDVESPVEAKEYLQQLRQILIYLGVCNGKMEEGSMRCEPNISVRKEGATELGTKSELKNLNSFRALQLGVDYEKQRQIGILESGGSVLQETRGWNADTEVSFPMRIKESENDYRYFPDPDLVPLTFSDEQVEDARSQLPEMPLAKLLRYRNDFGLSTYDGELLTADRAWADFFELAVAEGADPKEVCNLMTSDLAKLLNESGQTLGTEEGRMTTKVTPAHIAEVAKLRTGGEISSKIAKEVFDDMFRSGDMPKAIIARLGLVMVSDDSQIEAWCREVIAESPDPVQKYLSGQTNVIGFLVGQVMKRSQGKANPQVVQEVMKRVLGS